MDLRSRRRATSALIVVSALALALGLVPLLPAPAATAQAAGTVELASITGAGDQSRGRWKRFPIEVPHDADVSVTIDWTGDGDVNGFVYDAENTVVARANSTSARPERIETSLAAGSYDLAVLVKTGAAEYEASVRATAPAPHTLILGTGDQEQGRWQKYPFTVADNASLTIHTGWNGEANVNVFLRRDGETVAYSNDPDAPMETVRYDARAGDYEVAVLVKTGAADYVTEVYDSPVPPSEPQASPPSEEELQGPAYAGQPSPGALRWGAAVGGNSDPVARHETPAGTPLSLRRTFFQWNHRTTSLPATAEKDLAVGRLPWVSIKTPAWEEMGAGDHDAGIDELLLALDRLDGPVWLTVHHEPEGGGGVNRPDQASGPAGHRAMNRRVRERMDALGTDNVALGPVLMSWSWDPASGRDPAEWWEDGIYDFLGVDHYVYKERPLLNEVWSDIRAFAADRDTDIAVGEWGLRGTDAVAGQRVRDWFDAAANSSDDGKGARVVGLAAFDSGLNSPSGTWELQGEQLRVFQELMKDPRTRHASES